jgi:hypothetical protein
MFVPLSVLTVEGTGFRLDGQPFPFTGLSFFNAIYNAPFQRARLDWLRQFQRHGINVLRVWAQWDNARGFVDASPQATLYQPGGLPRPSALAPLQALLTDAATTGVVIELCLFAQESWRENIRLDPAAMDTAVRALARELKPWRNLVFQIWNEFSHRTADCMKIVKAEDPQRLVTSSPGFAGVLTGTPEETRLADFLTPHTSRQNAGPPWEVAPAEIAYLLRRYRKPVVDDEPARNGTASFGGPNQPTSPFDHILQIARVWSAGAHVVYHHDMFQTGAGSSAVPPSGIPEPGFSPYHRVVFDFLAQRARYQS